MTKYQRAVEEYYRLKPTEFADLQSLQLTQAIGPEGEYEQTLAIVLRKSVIRDESRLYIDFRGVRHLKFQQPDWSLISIGHLEILVGENIPSIYGNFLVRDPEQEQIIRFECREFTAVVG